MIERNGFPLLRRSGQLVTNLCFEGLLTPPARVVEIGNNLWIVV